MAVHSAERGGAQVVALGQARALRLEHDLVIAVGPGPLHAAFAEAATAVVRRPAYLPNWAASRSRWGLQIARVIPDAMRFAWIVWRRRIDVVVVNSTVLVSPVVGAWFAGVPVIVHAQEAPKSAAAIRLFRVHGLLANTVVAISPWIAQVFAGARASVLQNPVGIQIPRDPGPRDMYADDPLRLVMVGTVDRQKRGHVAIEAVAALRGQGLEAELTLHGLEVDPAYAAELRDQARDLEVARHVVFAGPTWTSPPAC